MALSVGARQIGRWTTPGEQPAFARELVLLWLVKMTIRYRALASFVSVQ